MNILQEPFSKTSKTSMTYFLNRVINTKSWGDMSDSDDDVAPVAPVAPAPKTSAKVPKTWAKLPTVPATPDTPGIRTLMVKNLPRDTTPEKLANELRSIFRVHGPIKDVYIPINRDGIYAGTIKGFAKVQFHKYQDAAKAIHPIVLRTNTLSIQYANQDR